MAQSIDPDSASVTGSDATRCMETDSRLSRRPLRLTRFYKNAAEPAEFLKPFASEETSKEGPSLE